jgi:hypothetical protein
LDGESAGEATVKAHEYAVVREGARVRWFCSCGAVGRWNAKYPYAAWLKHRPDTNHKAAYAARRGA